MWFYKNQIKNDKKTQLFDNKIPSFQLENKTVI